MINNTDPDKLVIPWTRAMTIVTVVGLLFWVCVVSLVIWLVKS